MSYETVRLTLVDGPTLLIELGGLRILTDPTFDGPQTYDAGGEVLKKLNAAPLSAESLLPIDVILLSHDQHFDNLDHLGRASLPKAGIVVSTEDAQARLGGKTMGLAPWASTTRSLGDGRTLKITATPARHGPVGIEPVTGHVVGFVLSIGDGPGIYLSGDTVWYEGTAEVAKRFDIGLAILFTGSAQPRGPFNVTMSSNDAIEAANAMPEATIVGIHNHGWSHYAQSQRDLERAFKVVGLEGRIQPLSPGQAVTIDVGVLKTKSSLAASLR